MADGTLSYQITLDSDQAVAALKRFGNVSNQVDRQVSSLRGSAGAAAAPFTRMASAQSAASAAGSALAGSLGLSSVAASGLLASLGPLLPVLAAIGVAMAGFQALGQGIGLANEAEKTAIAFKTLTGNAEQAQAVIGMLSQMAIDTPFSESEIQGGARALLAARVPASQLKTELRAIGNIASATNGDVGRLATVYAQVAGKGKLYAEELQQFVEQGAGELRQAVASTLGVTTAQLMEMMQAGEVGFSTLQQAIQDLAGETGKWGGAMSDQSQTNLGLLSSLGDNVGKIFRLLATPISDGPLKSFLAAAVEVSSQVSTVLGAAMAKGEIGKALGMALILGAKTGFNAIADFLDTWKVRFALWSAQVAAMVGNMLSGNVEAAQAMAQQVASFDLGKMRFDTGNEKEYFKSLIDGAKAAEESLGKASATWAQDLDSTGKTGDAAKAGKAQADAEAKAYKDHLDQQMKDSALRDDLAKEKADAGKKAADNLFGNAAYQVKKPAAAPRSGGGYRDNSIMAGAQVAGQADAKIQGYSREKQGGADAARGRAQAGMTAARGRVEADTARGFGTLYNPRPTAPGAAVNATLTPGGPGQAAAGRAGGADSGNAQLVGKLDAVIAELQRIRTE